MRKLFCKYIAVEKGMELYSRFSYDTDYKSAPADELRADSQNTTHTGMRFVHQQISLSVRGVRNS